MERVKDEYHRAEAELEKRLPPPCGGCPVTWQELGRDRHALVVPTHTRMVDSFDPRLWSGMSPGVFVYGDCVFGIERRSECDVSGLTFGVSKTNYVPRMV